MASGKGWTEHALSALNAAGYRAGGARTAVVSLLGKQDCCLSAKEIADRIQSQGDQAGIASVYRALELLDELKLVQRVTTGEGTTRYEPALPSGDHHHHIVCERCGAVTAFEDEGLELSLSRLEDRLSYSITGHEVSLHGLCPKCQT